MNEATININGSQLSTGESMTIRVALELFLMDKNEILKNDSDPKSKKMAELYKRSTLEILNKIHAR